MFIYGNLQEFQDETQYMLLNTLSGTSVCALLLTISTLGTEFVLVMGRAKKVYIRMIFVTSVCFLTVFFLVVLSRFILVAGSGYPFPGR